MHRTSFLAIASVVTVSSILAGCGSSSSSSPSTTALPAAAATTAPVSTAPTVELADSALGSILTTADGQTLYLFTKDIGDASACSGGCATAWPALAGPVIPGAGLDAEDFATITRDDGSIQTTFYGHPLYTYAGDAAPGDTTGQASNGVWFVVGAEGDAVTASSDPGKNDPGY